MHHNNISSFSLRRVVRKLRQQPLRYIHTYIYVYITYIYKTWPLWRACFIYKTVRLTRLYRSPNGRSIRSFYKRWCPCWLKVRLLFLCDIHVRDDGMEKNKYLHLAQRCRSHEGADWNADEAKLQQGLAEDRVRQVDYYHNTYREWFLFQYMLWKTYVHAV